MPAQMAVNTTLILIAGIGCALAIGYALYWMGRRS